MINGEMYEEFDKFQFFIAEDQKSIRKIESKKITSNLIYVVANYLSLIILSIALIVRIIRAVFDFPNMFYKQIHINYLLDLVILSTGLFLFFSICTYFFITGVLYIESFHWIESYISTIQLFSLECWIIFCYFIVGYVVNENNFIYYNLLLLYIQSIMITFILLILVNIGMKRFKKIYNSKFLKHKLQEIEASENISTYIKKFYKQNIVGDTSENFSNDILVDFYEIQKSNELEIKKNEYDETFLKPPVFKNIEEVLEVGKTVFNLISSNDKFIDFNEFSILFPNQKTSLSAFYYFDSRTDYKISKKEFLNTLMHFFQLRLLLTRSIKSKREFGYLLEQIIYFLILSIVLLIFLLLVGISLSKIYAFMFSSAIIVHFFGSNFIDEIIKNIVFILGHPYDIGDAIFLNNKELRVQKIGLFNTSFINEDGGLIKLLNVDICKSSFINITKSPENNLTFSFKITSNFDYEQLTKLNEKILDYLKDYPYEYQDIFELINKNTKLNDILSIECSLILKCRGFKTKSKKLILRTRFNNFLRKLLSELEISYE